jgi:metal-responsive CopG/Arc/MetJ family transcriptional regulator
MARTTKILGFSVPPEVAEAFKETAKRERRTKSELFREMFRLYQRYQARQRDADDAGIMQMIQEAQAEPMSETDLLKAGEALAHYGAQRARALGYADLDEDVAQRLIDEP